MIIRKCSSDGDWQFGKGNSNYARNQDAVRENIRTRLLSWKNNCFFALQDGIDYQTLLDKGQQAALTAAIKLVILTSYGVIRLNNLTAVLDVARTLTVTCNVDTIFGQNFTMTISQ